MYKLTAYQRIEVLLDRGTFEEIGVANVLTGLKHESIITGYGKINNRKIFIIASDVSSFSGSVGQKSVEKVNRLLDLAMQNKSPVITLFESVGARIQEGVSVMHQIGLMFKRFSEISGVVPTISILFGVNSGVTTYCSALMDFTIMVEHKSFSFITGPKVIEKMTGEKTTNEELGGSVVHSRLTGLASVLAENERDALYKVKELLEYLPQHYDTIPPPINVHLKKSDSAANMLSTIIPPDEDKSGYDMLQLINGIIDDDTFYEINKAYAKNLLAGFAKLGNATIGIIANQPSVMSGVLDVSSCKKLFRFVQICDAYAIPVLFIADSPGFMPGKYQEHNNIIGIGAKVLHVLSTSTMPKITLIVNKIIGGAYGGMSAKSMGSDIVFAWPTAKISILGDTAAIRILHQKELEKTDNIDFLKNKRTNEFIEEHLSPYPAAQHGQIDAIIHPEETRMMIMKGFKMLENKAINTSKKRRSVLPF